MISILLTGAISDKPEMRTSKSGKSYAATTVKVSAGGEDESWAALAFSTETCAALMGLGLGETVALQGTPKFDVDGEDEQGRIRVRKALFVAAVLTTRGWPHERRRKAKRPAEPASLSLFDWKPKPEFDDGVPF